MKAGIKRNPLENFVRQRAPTPAPTSVASAAPTNSMSKNVGKLEPGSLDILVESLLDEQNNLSGPASSKRLGVHYTTVYKYRARRDETRARAKAEKHPSATLILSAAELKRKPAPVAAKSVVSSATPSAKNKPVDKAPTLPTPIADPAPQVVDPVEERRPPAGAEAISPPVSLEDVDPAPSGDVPISPPEAESAVPSSEPAPLREGSIRISVEGSGHLEIAAGSVEPRRLDRIGFLLSALVEAEEDIFIDARGADEAARDAVLTLVRQKVGAPGDRRIVLVDDIAVLVLTSRQTAASLLDFASSSR
jgi:hypothetical protein